MHGSARCLPFVAAFALLALLFGPGCARYNYRERADKDVAGIISQKNVFPDWQVKKDWHVYPDPRARFADASNPDRPPYPPDDYAAKLLAPNPQRPTKKSGVGRQDGEGYVSLLQQWDAENRADDPNAPPARAAAMGPTKPPAGAPNAPVSKDGFPVTTGAPNAAQAERPAVRHSVPPGFPGAGQTPPAAPVAKSNNEIGPWVAAAKRGPQSPVPATATNSAPHKTPLHPPVITVISGDAESTGKAVPAVALVPVQPVPVPPIDSLPPILPPGTEPKALDLKQPPGPDNPGKTADPMGKGPPELYPSVLTTGSDPASEYLKALESGQTGYRLKLDQAIELGLFNAREYQDRREDLYLIALPVTLERFNFAAQAFFTEQVIRESTGRQLANGGERWSLNTTGGVNKLFPTGAMLMVKLANQITIDLSGDKPQTSISNLSLSLMQPFLRGGGFAVTLEDLTQAERTLVYAMRSYTRFRKLFYVALAAGGSGGGYTNNPYGLQGLSPNLGRGIGGNLTAPNIGYLPLLQQSATLNNQRKNVVALERLLQLYQAFREGGQQSDLQVGQVEVQLLTNRSQLLGSANTGASQSGIRGFLDSLDNFKLQLGLPITVPLELDDGPLRPIRQQLGRFEEVYAQVQQTELAAAKYDPAEPVAQFRARWRNLLTDSALVKGTPFAKSIGERLDSWAPAKLTDDQAATRLAQLREERRKLLAARADRQVKGLPEPEADTRKIALLEDDIDLGDFERLVRIYESQPWTKVTTPTARATAQAAAFRDVFNSFYQLILEGRNDRLTAVRSQWPTLPPLTVGDTGTDVLVAPLDDAYTAAIQTALTNRLDLMNARGQVVDAWRQIAIQANSLQGVFNVRYDLSSNTPAGRNNGLAFAADRSNHQLVFNAELPLVRRAERNNYRAALIGYQRQRRTLMAFEDNITNDVRSDLRELRTLAQLYRIQQRVVELGYSQVDNAQAILLAPPAPGAANDAGSAAALTQQVLDAQNRLVTAQNTLFQLWVAYQIGRMQLYVDLEQMTLDDRGVWIDEFFNRTDAQNRSPADGQRPGERLHAPQPVGAGGK